LPWSVVMAALEPETGGNEAKEQDEKSQDGLRLGYHCTKDNSRLRVSVVAPTLPQNLKRLPVLLCCVVDTSGSMQVDAVIKDASGKAESAGLSVLALVKHSIKTIVTCLEDDDYLSIVAYSSEARVVTELQPMTKKNRETTLAALDALSPSGQTNLWDGLHTGLEMLRKAPKLDAANKNSAVLLFTDGLPNIVPPKGHMGMLEKYIDTHQTLPGTINTYGFGYSLDTALLCELSVRGQGSYAFIPDSSMVGTIFVNSLANLCCNVAKNTTLKLEANHARYDVTVLGGYDTQRTSWGVQINLGNVMYGQNRDIVVDFTPREQVADDEADEANTEDVEGKEQPGADDGSPYSLDADALSYISLRTSAPVKSALSCLADDNAGTGQATRRHYYRLRVCDELRECMGAMNLNDMDSAQKRIRDLITEIKGDKVVSGDAAVAGLLADLSGQGFEAISKREYYEKWGRHYLPSLIGAHLQQMNNNFKDPGVQFYGGGLFEKLRDTANDIFIKLPPPKARQVQSYGHHGYGGGVMLGGGGGGGGAKRGKAKGKAKKRVDMKQFYNVGGGCFGGRAKVKMLGGVEKRVDEVVRGDVCENGGVVVCVVRYRCAGGRVRMCEVGEEGLMITEYHPVRIGGEWVFPVEVDGVESREVEMEWVYNFVLSAGHVMKVGGVECCTLGHGMRENVVIEHEYFGTTKVVDDLRRQKGWGRGVVMMEAGAVSRDPESNLVTGLV